MKVTHPAIGSVVSHMAANLARSVGSGKPPVRGLARALRAVSSGNERWGRTPPIKTNYWNRNCGQSSYRFPEVAPVRQRPQALPGPEAKPKAVSWADSLPAIRQINAAPAPEKPAAAAFKSLIPIFSGIVQSDKPSEPQRKSAHAISSAISIRDACAAAPGTRLRLLPGGGVFILGEQVAPDYSRFGIATDSPAIEDAISDRQFEQEERLAASDHGYAMLRIAAEAQRVSRALLGDALGCPYTPLELEDMPRVPDLDESEYVRPASVRLIDAPEPTARQPLAAHAPSRNLMDEDIDAPDLPPPMPATRVMRRGVDVIRFKSIPD